MTLDSAKIFNRSIFTISLLRISRNSITTNILLFKFELFFSLQDSIRRLILRLKYPTDRRSNSSIKKKKKNKFHKLPCFDVFCSLQQIYP